MVCSGLPAGRCVHLTRERKTQPDTAREHSGLQHSPFRRASQQWFQPGRDTKEKGKDRKEKRKEWQKKLKYRKVSHKVQKGWKEGERKEMKERLWATKSSVLQIKETHTHIHRQSHAVANLHLICTVWAPNNHLSSRQHQSTGSQLAIQGWNLWISHIITWLKLNKQINE